MGKIMEIRKLGYIKEMLRKRLEMFKTYEPCKKSSRSR
jgi:hypothetical protein